MTADRTAYKATRHTACCTNRRMTAVRSLSMFNRQARRTNRRFTLIQTYSRGGAMHWVVYIGHVGVVFDSFFAMHFVAKRYILQQKCLRG